MGVFKSLVVVAAVVALGGCVTTNSTMLGQASVAAPLDPSAVAIYRTADQVKANYREVALLNSAGDSGMTNERGMYESMKKEAARIGANGVILDAISEPSAGTKVAAAIFGVSAQRKGRAVAIFVEGGPDGATHPPKARKR